VTAAARLVSGEHLFDLQVLRDDTLFHDKGQLTILQGEPAH
jgi:hypothetical protein